MGTESIIIYAPNIHQGGGKALLIPLLKELKDRDGVIFILDERLVIKDTLPPASVIRVRATVWSRFKNELRIRKIMKDAVDILCLGNLPPLFSKYGDVTVFIQNRYLVDSSIKYKLSHRVNMRLWLESLWLRLKCRVVTRFIVQTRTMRKLLKEKYDRESDVIPFIPEIIKSNKDFSNCMVSYDYVYVASGESHKNHRMLVDAWIELSRRNIYPKLCLTLNESHFPELTSWVEVQIRKYKLNIVNVGELAHEDVFKLYRQTKAMIYPSLFESFGIPLIDAVMLELPVLVSDADYVYDIIDPFMTFDPNSSVSIADSVAGFSFDCSKLIIEPCTAKVFLEKVVTGYN